MKSSLYECLFKEIENTLQDQKYQELYGKIKEQNKFAIYFGVIATIAAIIYIWLIITSICVWVIMYQSKHISNLILGFLVVLVLFMVIISIACLKKIRVIEKYDKPNKVIYKLLKIMACDESLYNRFNQILAEIPNKNFAMNILESDFKCESKLKNSPKFDTIKKWVIDVTTGVIGSLFFYCIQQMIQQNIIYLSRFIVIIFPIIMALYAGWSVYKSYYIDLNGALKLYIEYYVTDEYKNC